MILFTILMIALALTALITVITLLVGGTAFIVVFGDVIIFAVILVLMIKAIKKRKKK